MPKNRENTSSGYDVLRHLDSVWNEVAGMIRVSNHVLRPFWSEPDLAHFIATKLQARFGNGYAVHVSSSLSYDDRLFPDPVPHQFSNFVQRYKDETHVTKRKIAPDLMVHVMSTPPQERDFSHFKFIGETKLILGFGGPSQWNGTRERVRNDLIRLRILRDVGLCDEVAMLFAYHPIKESAPRFREICSDIQTTRDGVHVFCYPPCP